MQLKRDIRYRINAFNVAASGLGKESRNILAQVKNSHSGQRCFILGNGPNLRAKDLSCLKGCGFLKRAKSFLLKKYRCICLVLL